MTSEFESSQKKVTLGYLRVSTQDQNTESQARALADWCAKQGITNFEMFTDHGISGAKESRPALNELMKRVEGGDVEQVVVFAFSRFARSTTHLLKALEIFRAKNVRFISITEALDTNSPMGLALFTILGALAQMEREIIRNRVIAGLKNAREKGVHIGRVKKRDSDLIRKLLKAGMSFREVARVAVCSHGSIHAEKVAMKKEEAALAQQKLQEQMSSTTEAPPTPTDPPPESPSPNRPSLRLV